MPQAPMLCHKPAPSPAKGNFRARWAPAPWQQQAAVVSNTANQLYPEAAYDVPVPSPTAPFFKARKKFGAGRATPRHFS